MADCLSALLVEDDAADIELIRTWLERDGIKLEWRAAASEAQLLRALDDFTPDVVLCDYRIPGYSGRDALDLVHAQRPFVPFLFVSGTIGEDVAVACLRQGATDYVLKSNLRRLPAAVRRAVQEAKERLRMHEIEDERRRLAEILAATTDMVVMTDPDSHITYVNESGCRLLGRPREEVLGKTADSLLAPWAREIVRSDAVPAALQSGVWQGETAVLTQEGTPIPLSQVLIAHRGCNGTPRFFSTIARDIRDRKAYEARIHHLANFDALTGLPNATLLADRAAQAIVHLRRTGRSLAVAIVDLDAFRLVDQSFGRAAADQVLVDVSAQLRDNVREGDTVARIGADEFAVLLPDLARPDDAAAVVSKLLHAVALPRRVGDHELRITATAGIAVFPEDGPEFDVLLPHAEAATQGAKRDARGGFRFHSGDVTSDARRRLRLDSGLRCALQRGELMLEYQPQYDLRSGQPCGVEALMRWVRADGQTVAPGLFIPIAEDTGLIASLGEWALEEACTTVLAWPRSHMPRLTVAVNVSMRQMNTAFCGAVSRTLRKTGFPASSLELEITESTLMSNVADAIESFARLKRLGVRIAVDDFGTGYSSLSYLSRLPIDRLKVDRTFVLAMTTDSQDATIVQAIVSLGHALGLSVIAEGVETEEQHRMLQRLGCDQAQGFFFSRPLSATATLALLADARAA